MDTSKFATKSDLKKESKLLRTEILRVEKKVEDIEDEIKEFRAETKADKQGIEAKLDKLQNTLDGFVGVADDLRTDNTVGVHHVMQLQLKVDDHEKRLSVIESPK